MNNNITFVACWWTIDKDYSILKGSYDFIIWKPRIANILKNIRLNYWFEVIELIKKDSLDMTDDDRNLILETVKKVKNDKIIITHWTDTMIDTWEKLKQIKDKKIILIWSSKPQIFKDSDADFNIWFAMWVINTINKNWIYIVMNWELFEIGSVEKTQEGFFKKLNNN